MNLIALSVASFSVGFVWRTLLKKSIITLSKDS